MASEDYITLNKASWDEKAPEHARAPDYAISKLLADPSHLSNVVRFDIPLIGSISGLSIVHLQCHIGTDTLSLARRGAAQVTGLDFSRASLDEARKLAASAEGGERVSFVEASTYEALSVLEKGEFDMVFTGIGALCWLPSIARWAGVVHALLKPGGRLFIREAHPLVWTLDEHVHTHPQVRYPYFERAEPVVFDEGGTYVKLEDGEGGEKVFTCTRTMEWNHGLGEIVQALIDVGMEVTGLVEHRCIPWEALPGQMVERGDGEFELAEEKDRLPLSYTLQAVKKR